MLIAARKGALASRVPDMLGHAERSSPTAASRRAEGAGRDGEGADRAIILRGQFGLGLQSRHRLLDLRQPFLLIAGPVRHLVTTLVFAEGLVLLGSAASAAAF